MAYHVSLGDYNAIECAIYAINNGVNAKEKSMDVKTVNGQVFAIENGRRLSEMNIEYRIYKMLMQWRKTKSIKLASDICNKLLYQDGKYTDEDIDEIENMFNDLYG